MIAVNGKEAVGGTISLPRVGIWHAELVVESEEPIEGACTISIDDGKLELKGTLYRGAVYQDTAFVRIVAGADGLRKDAKPKHYTNQLARNVLDDLGRDGGEKISGDLGGSFSTLQLSAWT